MMLVNGHAQSALPVDDRGLAYGDGLFETMAVVDGRPRLWRYHYERLASGCERLAIPLPDETLLLDEIGQCAAGKERSVVKLILTRGSGGRGYRVPEHPQPRRIFSRHPWPDYPSRYRKEGIAARLCETELSCQPSLAGIKHLNRLDQVLARNEWQTDEPVEGIMCDRQGRVIEGIMSNLFLVKEDRLVTPSLSTCGVAGVMRRCVLELASASAITTEVRDVFPDELNEADELMFSNALIGLWPVGRLELPHRHRHIGQGPVYRRLNEILNDYLEGHQGA